MEQVKEMEQFKCIKYEDIAPQLNKKYSNFTRISDNQQTALGCFIPF